MRRAYYQCPVIVLHNRPMSFTYSLERKTLY